MQYRVHHSHYDICNLYIHSVLLYALPYASQSVCTTVIASTLYIALCVIIDMHYGICKYSVLFVLCIIPYYVTRYIMHHNQNAQRATVCVTVSAHKLHSIQSHPFLYSRTIFYTLCYMTTMSNKYTITYLLMLLIIPYTITT